MSGPKILIWDIETSPHKAWTFQTRKAFITPEMIIEPTRMICWAAKWLGEKRIQFRSEYHHSTEEMVETLWRLLDESDANVTYNGDNFDHKHFNRERHLAGLPKPSPSISIDMYKIIRKDEVWASHKMDYLTKSLSLSEKLAHHGFLLWREALGDFGPERQEKAWRIMRLYNKRDIPATEDLFTEYLPLITTLPSAGLWTPEKAAQDEIPECPNPLCHVEGAVTRQGWKRTKTRRYRQYQCQACGRWFSETRSESGVTSA